MHIRNVTMSDLEEIVRIEQICFPPNQAATEDTFTSRIKKYPAHFWVIENDWEIIGFINGMVTNNDRINDLMFKDVNLHIENGMWQSVFGLAILPKYQKMGYAGKLINHLIEVTKQNNRTGIILTCEQHLMAYYEKFGFVNIGLSASVHGGDIFFDMKRIV